MVHTSTLKDRIAKWAERHAKKRSACCAGGFVPEQIPEKESTENTEETNKDKNSRNGSCCS